MKVGFEHQGLDGVVRNMRGDGGWLVTVAVSLIIQ
mgnify:CR=1 FL=1